MRTLVVNADDLGLHPAIDAGILRAHREGIVTSVNEMVVQGSVTTTSVASSSLPPFLKGVMMAV